MNNELRDQKYKNAHLMARNKDLKAKVEKTIIQQAQSLDKEMMISQPNSYPEIKSTNIKDIITDLKYKQQQCKNREMELEAKLKAKELDFEYEREKN